MGTQDQIVLQTQRMAEQIQQLNDIYNRMIKAMTIAVPAAGVGVANTQEAAPQAPTSLS
jgi:tetrahydromethanopterin S-methyltransferase subunit B